jgi:hypothetical protein
VWLEVVVIGNSMFRGGDAHSRVVVFRIGYISNPLPFEVDITSARRGYCVFLV